jgi:hypothetical protein
MFCHSGAKAGTNNTQYSCFTHKYIGQCHIGVCMDRTSSHNSASGNPFHIPNRPLIQTQHVCRDTSASIGPSLLVLEVHIPIKHLVATGALEAHLVILLASGYFLFGHVDRLATARAFSTSSKARHLHTIDELQLQLALREHRTISRGHGNLVLPVARPPYRPSRPRGDRKKGGAHCAIM